uniref:Uncharacterized protein n=1 Tax=Arundo donax TaxID=35708 RepID=A0A0A9D023_ARUDO
MIEDIDSKIYFTFTKKSINQSIICTFMRCYLVFSHSFEKKESSCAPLYFT